ncbi:MAG TPA: hypothetical protein VHO06_18955 [Polyangia bacterium]|nr:hypothetical protein [Polyangia bacterium]
MDSAAAALAAAVAAVEPLRVSPFRQAQVLARVLEGRRPRQWLLRMLLRPAFTLAVLLLAGIATAATAAPRLRLLHWGWLSAQKTAPPVQPQPSPLIRTAAPSWAEPPAEAPPPDPRPPASRPHARAGARESPARVVAAVRALRSEDDPARAQRLALEYLRVYPRGALAEEALAIAIDAGARCQDPQIGRLAARYLRSYPNGRFRQVAQEALLRGR